MQYTGWAPCTAAELRQLAQEYDQRAARRLPAPHSWAVTCAALAYRQVASDLHARAAKLDKYDDDDAASPTA